MSQSVLAIAPTLAVVDGTPTTTSVDVAAFFGKQHNHVLRDIENLCQQLPQEALSNFGQGSYTLAETGDQQHRMYRLTRDGFTLLAMGFTGKKALAFKLAYIDAFNQMEAELYKPALPSPDEADMKRAVAFAFEASKESARAVFQAVLDPKLKGARAFVLQTAWDARLRSFCSANVTALEHEDFITSVKHLPKVITGEDSFAFDEKDLADIAAACIQQLCKRASYAQKRRGTTLN